MKTQKKLFKWKDNILVWIKWITQRLKIYNTGKEPQY